MTFLPWSLPTMLTVRLPEGQKEYYCLDRELNSEFQIAHAYKLVLVWDRRNNHFSIKTSCWGVVRKLHNLTLSTLNSSKKKKNCFSRSVRVRPIRAAHSPTHSLFPIKQLLRYKKKAPLSFQKSPNFQQSLNTYSPRSSAQPNNLVNEIFKKDGINVKLDL